MSADVLIEAQGLTKHFGSGERGFFRKPTVVRAVDGVSLTVRRGETYAIVGESGCGKSTLARLLLRLIEPTAGTVILDGAPITGIDGETLRGLRRRMQMIFQDPYGSLNPRLTVGALIEEPMAVHGLGTPAERRRNVADLLQAVGLRPDHASRYPHEFSGGQRQRIGIARALAAGPELIIGDEPVSALDVSIRAQVINLLEDLKAKLGLTLILVSHDLAVIRHTSDRVAVMYLGQIVEEAATDALFERPLHPYTRALMAAIPRPDPRERMTGALLEGDPPSPANPPPGCRFSPRCGHATDRCRTEQPALRTLGRRPDDAHTVACHHAEALAGAGTGLASAMPSDAKRRRMALFSAAQAART
jgi:peptide/nickel transport system ATP-binding protein